MPFVVVENETNKIIGSTRFCNAESDVFVKPTYAKKNLEIYELESLTYKPTPSLEFYESFREQINKMKRKVDPSLSSYNAAFTGFLVMGPENLT